MLSAKIRTKWIIGRTKWIIEYFSYLALVEYSTKWIRIKWGPGVFYTQSPFIRTSLIRLSAEFLGKFKTRALGGSNLRTTSKNLRTASAQIFKAKNQVLLPFLIHMYISFTCTYISSNFSLHISLFLFLSVNITECKTEFFVKKKRQNKKIKFKFFFWKNLRTG